MATLKQIRQRIKTAKNIQQITKAMKLVAAARLKKATDRVLESRPYADKLKEFMGSLSQAGELPVHPLMEKRETINKAILVVVTSERGLAGGYNTSIIRKAADFIKAAGFEVELVTIGKKGHQFFSKRGYKIIHSITMPSAGASLENAIEATRVTRQAFESGEADAIFVCYSKFYSAIRQIPQLVQLLPIEAPVKDDADGMVPAEVSFEPNAEAVLNALLPRYFQTLVWQSLLEGTASEFGARMTAMTSATDNAGKMIQSLTLKANRERQAGITTQILEVVGGAEALKG
ncbi:MAG: ATP synthase F1 subunit gamma [Armatimonadetes bacterium 55-13]|nr:ATP synthase F1 subunit gamma [Armatimonadota bacterium]OJU61453.1 MAG: ATP synthase F1 subunit gamma [Armatimonadetes bacterium 55-13]